MGLTSGKWQGMAWPEHRVKPSSTVLVRLCSRHRFTDVFSSLATQSCSLSVLQLNWKERKKVSLKTHGYIQTLRSYE